MERRHRLSRNEFGAMVMHRAATDPEFAKSLTIRDSEGRRAIVPVLGSDPVHRMADLARQLGGNANFVVLAREDDEGIRVIVGALTSEPARSDDHDVPVTPACTVADLVESIPFGSSITLRFDGDAVTLDEVTERQFASATQP